MQKGSTLALKPGPDVTRSPKQGYQWNPGQTSPEVQNRGISETQGRCHQKSKTGVSVKPRADVTRSPKQGYQWNPEQASPEVQNRGISGPTKRTYVLQFFLKKSCHSILNSLNIKFYVTFQVNRLKFWKSHLSWKWASQRSGKSYFNFLSLIVPVHLKQIEVNIHLNHTN